MRESGVEFLGEVPAHWDVQPAVTLARVLTSTVDKKSYEGERSVKVCNYTDVYYSDQIVDASNFMTGTASAEQIAKFSVRAGDVPFTKDSETADDIGIPSYVPNDLPDTVYGYHLSIFRPIDKRRGRFLRYLLESNYAKAYFAAKTPGVTRVGLGQATIRYFRVPTPPAEEAVAIADHLDRETAQLDAFIAKSEELIAHLTERRVAVITRLVTQGVRKGTDLTSSGITWAGEVPGDWLVGNIRRFATMKSGHTPSRQRPEYWVDCDIPWFTLADVWQLRQGRRIMGDTSEMISEIGLANSAAELLPAGTVSLSRTASVGFTGIMPHAMATSQDFWNWIPGDQLLSDYLWYQFQAMKPEFERLMMGSTHRTIYKADAASLMVLVPGVDEQRRIVELLEEETDRIDRAIAVAWRGVALAKERRVALISALVTGKVGVAA